MITIRPATLNDMDALSTFACRVFTDNFGILYVEEEMRAHLEKTCSANYFAERLTHDAIILACDGDIIAGYTKVGELGLPIETSANVSEIHRLYIDQPYQGKGVGKLLMEAALALPQVASSDAVYLGVWEHNHRAQNFYQKYGFVPVGEYPYHVGSTIDRELILRKTLQV